MSVTMFTPQESTSDMEWEESYPDSSNALLVIRNLSLILGHDEGEYKFEYPTNSYLIQVFYFEYTKQFAGFWIGVLGLFAYNAVLKLVGWGISLEKGMENINKCSFFAESKYIYIS